MKRTDGFWDSSALVPLCADRGASHLARSAKKARTLAVWWGTPVEITSAFSRLHRSGDLSQGDFRAALDRLTDLRGMWIEVQPTNFLRGLAEALLRRHPLRAADALQLAAALVWANQKPEERTFMCLDKRLAEAARKEGFVVELI